MPMFLMVYFLSVFFLLYGGMNFYVFWKIRAAWGEVACVTWAAALFIGLMVIAPIFIRVLERHNAIGFSRVLAFVAFIWMALAFWFLVLGVPGDLWNFGVKAAAHWRPTAANCILGPRTQALAVIVLVAAAAVWGTLEACSIRLKTVRIPTARLAQSNGPVRLVQISDVHLSLILGRRTLARIVDIVNKAQPDVLVSTGDLSDGTFVEVNHLGGLLEKVPTRWGKYACFGNHESYAGLENSNAFHESAGFQILHGDAKRAGPLIIAGVDDPAIVPSVSARREQEKKALDAAHSLGDGPVVLLKHRPAPDDESKGQFDLQLSGHTHGGQIFPFGFVVYATSKVWPGTHKISEGGWLYLSRGTGTWGPPIRFLAPPEITAIDLIPG